MNSVNPVGKLFYCIGKNTLRPFKFVPSPQDICFTRRLPTSVELFNLHLISLLIVSVRSQSFVNLGFLLNGHLFGPLDSPFCPVLLPFLLPGFISATICRVAYHRLRKHNKLHFCIRLYLQWKRWELFHFSYLPSNVCVQFSIIHCYTSVFRSIEDCPDQRRISRFNLWRQQAGDCTCKLFLHTFLLPAQFNLYYSSRWHLFLRSKQHISRSINMPSITEPEQ